MNQIELELMYRDDGGIDHTIHVGDHVETDDTRNGLVTEVRYDNYVVVVFGPDDSAHWPASRLKVTHAAPWWRSTSDKGDDA